MKDKIIAVLMVLTVIMVPVMAANDVFAKCGGVETNIINCPEDASGEEQICHIMNLVVHIMAVGVGILAAIGITVTGIQYLTAGGNEEKVRKSKRRMFELVIGLALFVTTASIIDWLMPGGLFCGQTADSSSAGDPGSGSGSGSGDGAGGDSGAGAEVIESGTSPNGDEGWVEEQ